METVPLILDDNPLPPPPNLVRTVYSPWQQYLQACPNDLYLHIVRTWCVLEERTIGKYYENSSYKKIYFPASLEVSTTNTNTLFTAMQPPLEYPGEVVFGQSPDGPLPLHLELRQGHSQDSQLPFRHVERK